MADLLLRAGSAIITPSRAGELAGYAARDGARSTATHDDLEAALLVLDDGARRVAWLTLDAIGVDAALDAGLRTSVGQAFPDAALMVVASHTHSAPLGWTGGIHPGHAGRRDAEMIAELVDRVGALAAEIAARPAAPVEATWSVVPVPGVGTNRLDPSGPHDDRAGVLALREEGRLRAVLYDFATHPTVLGPANLAWSADWPGAARAAVRAVFVDDDPVIAFLQGAAGDVSTRFTRRADDAAEVARLGGLVADAVIGAARSGGRVLEPVLATAEARPAFTRRPLPDVAEASRAVDDATAALAALHAAPLDPTVRLAQTRLDGARVQRDLAVATLPAEVELPLAVVVLGDVAWAHLPVEPFASVGAEVQARSPYADTRVVGYSNGYAGYLADVAAHHGASYEALSSYFPAEAAGAVADALVDLLADVHTSTAIPVTSERP